MDRNLVVIIQEFPKQVIFSELYIQYISGVRNSVIRSKQKSEAKYGRN